MYRIMEMFVAVFITTWIVGASGALHDPCRCVASNDSCWPTFQEWDAFNQTIGGRLIAPRPTGYSCHEPHFDATRCDIIRTNYFNSYLRADNAGSMQAENWEDKGATQRCSWEAPKSSLCHQGRVSVLGVQIQSILDIQKAVRFAAHHKLRVAVKSSGHDMLGRSAAAGSFLIWMHKMKKNISIEYNSFSNCGHPPISAVTIVGAVAWGEVYDKLKSTGYIVLGGMGRTICATGGYVQGGGHGVLGPLFGLAVDNVVQMELVTADGNLHTVNACNDPELFFALRGGGGGTFGVVTSVTYKLHKSPPLLVHVNLTASPTTSTTWSTATQEDVMTVWSRGMVALDAAHWGGYWTFLTTGFSGFFLVPGTEAVVNDTITAVVRALNNLENVRASVYVAKTDSYQDWYDAVYESYTTGTDYTGVRGLFGSRIIPYAALETPRALAKTIVHVMAKAGIPGVEGIMVIGPGVRGAGGVGVDTGSVTRAWRRGIWHLLTGSFWAWNATQEAEDAARKAGLVFVEELQKVYPDSGAYFNEASIDEPQWKQSFWGAENYARLVQTKVRVDPFGLFVCRNCVGSDLWQNSATCRIQAPH